MRMRALNRLGIGIVRFDTTPYLMQGWRIEQTLAHRLNVGRGVSALNTALCQSSDVLDADIIWIDKGVWIHRRTLAYLKDQSRCRIAVHYTPDAHFADNRSRHFESCLPLYDLAVTTKPFEVPAYRLHGARRTLCVLHGYGAFLPRERHCLARRAKLASDVCFIGHYQSHYARQLRAVASKRFDLRVWGSKWPRYTRYSRWARQCVAGNGLWGDEYVSGLASSKIALGLLSRRIPEAMTTRSFEIPAVGTFMLAERTNDHQTLFEEGVEAEFFGSKRELCDKIGFYLSRDGLRQRLAARGQQRCLRSGYSALEQLRRVLDDVADLLGESIV